MWQRLPSPLQKRVLTINTSPDDPRNSDPQDLYSFHSSWSSSSRETFCFLLDFSPPAIKTIWNLRYDLELERINFHFEAHTKKFPCLHQPGKTLQSSHSHWLSLVLIDLTEYFPCTPRFGKCNKSWGWWQYQSGEIDGLAQVSPQWGQAGCWHSNMFACSAH